MSAKTAVAIVAGCALVCGTAAAHKINPLHNKYKQGAHTIARRVSQPVHEEMTQLARACQLAHPEALTTPLVCTDRSEPSTEPKGNKQDALVRGVWWNDDPNQLLFAARQAKMWAWMRDAQSIAVEGKNWKGKKAAIGPDYYMSYRSHYGDLQFLHAMASGDGESPQATQQHILSWAEFAFAVATGRLDPETTMTSVTPGVRAFFPIQSGWTVNYLFAPLYRLRSPQYARMMAAGSLLHMVQDSYSAAHADRGFDATAQCPLGRVVQFYSYIHQDPDRHGEADFRSAWQARTFTDAQDPVNVSATLLAYIDQEAEWNTVKTYLQDTVFCIDARAKAAGPGPFAAPGWSGTR